MRFIDADSMVDWLAEQCTCYPAEVTAAVDGEEIAVEVVLDDGTPLHSGWIGEYPSDVELRSLAPVLFNKLVVAIALRRMQLPRGETQRHED